MSVTIYKFMGESLNEIIITSIAIVILVAFIAAILEILGIIPDTWIEPIITFTTEWLFSPDRIITKFIFIFLGISGLSVIGVSITILIKNVLGD